jgi:hypothetical protein
MWKRVKRAEAEMNMAATFSKSVRIVLKTLTGLASAGALVALTACTDNAAEVRTVTLENRMSLTGKVQDNIGKSTAGALIWIDGLDGIRAESRADGTWETTLSGDDLVRISARNMTSSFRIHATALTASGPKIAGVSTAIDGRERGKRAVETIVLGPTASLSGVIWVQRQGQRPQPVEGARVRLGRSEAKTLADGTFRIDDVPAGTDLLQVSATGLESFSREISLLAGENKNLAAPIILFPANAVAGWVQLLPQENVEELVGIGRPFLRSFRVLPSPRAALIRYGSDAEKFEGDPATATNWLQIQEIMDHDFPASGGVKLRVQFSDADKTTFSEIYELVVVVDLFKTSNGISIGDGSGITTSRNVTINVDVPAGAYRMRLADTELGLRDAEWQEPKPAVNFVFPLRADTTNGEILANGLRQIHLQFADALGNNGPVYLSTVNLLVFPPAEEAGGVFQINAGAPTSEFHTVELNIKIPPTAQKMRVWEIGPDSGRGGFTGIPGVNGFTRDTSNVWLEPVPRLFYNFASPGHKILYVQFKDIDDARSPAYQREIRIDQLSVSPIGFTVLNGPDPLSRALTLDLNWPPHVREYRIFDDTGAGTGWRLVEPLASYIVGGFGPRIISVEYRTIDGDVIPASTANVFIDPFPPGSYGFDFVPGTFTSFIQLLPLLPTAVTQNSVARLLITPPPGAREYAALVDNGQNGPQWEAWLQWFPLNLDPAGNPLPVIHDLPLGFSAGDKRILVRFRGDEISSLSPIVQRVISLQPFHPALVGMVLNAGQATATDPNLTINVNLGGLNPAQVVSWRASENLFDLQTLPWQTLPLSQVVPFTASTGTGVKTVYVQFKTEFVESAVFSDTIEVVPPPPPPPP